MHVTQWHRPSRIVGVDALHIRDPQAKRTVFIDYVERPTRLVLDLVDQPTQNVKRILSHLGSVEWWRAVFRWRRIAGRVRMIHCEVVATRGQSKYPIGVTYRIATLLNG
jgi:hypothetical protein